MTRFWPELSHASVAQRVSGRIFTAAGVDPALRKGQVRCCSIAEHEESPQRTAALGRLE